MSGSDVLRELDGWLHASIAEAERLLPDVLDMPASAVRRELRKRPELRTAGMMRRLITTAHDAVRSYPRRARELTAIAVDYADAITFPAAGTILARMLEAQAWREHANALRAAGETSDALRAAAMARHLFDQLPAAEWYVATVDLIEGEILHDLGEREAALQLVRQAASLFALHRDHEQFLDAQLSEAWMLWEAGDPSGAADVWRAIVETALLRGDSALMARLAKRVGFFELRHGDAADASRIFSTALAGFEAAGLQREATEMRWRLAEAAAARGRANEAISEYYKVSAELLARGDLLDAAIASVEILALLLSSARSNEVAPVIQTFLTTFREAGMGANALQAFLYLRSRNAANEITTDDLASVRRYFEDLAQQPKAAFVPPS